MNLAYIPSPPTGVVHIGPVPLRAYAFCIILGVIAAIAIGERRWVARGGEKGLVGDIAIWAVPFGLVGGRLYHVITSYELYFGPGGEPVRALYVWQGGLGIWGAIVLGGVGAWIGCRRRGVRLPVFADAVAPGIAVAQAIGRWGNWFNQELFGRPTTLPWGLEIDPARRPATSPDVATYHPTFLYEFFWNLGVAGLVVWADRKWRLGHGRAFALYVAAYCAGRGWIEYLRVDEAHHVLGLRLNVWTSILVFLGAVVYLALSAKLRPGREETVLLPSAAPAAAAGDAAEAPTAVLSQGAAEATTLPKAPPVEEEKQEEKPGVAVAEAPTGKLPKAPPVEQPVAVKDEEVAAEEAAKARAEQEAEQVEAAERAGEKTQAGEKKPTPAVVEEAATQDQAEPAEQAAEPEAAEACADAGEAEPEEPAASKTTEPGTPTQDTPEDEAASTKAGTDAESAAAAVEQPERVPESAGDQAAETGAEAEDAAAVAPPPAEVADADEAETARDEADEVTASGQAGSTDTDAGERGESEAVGEAEEPAPQPKATEADEPEAARQEAAPEAEAEESAAEDKSEGEPAADSVSGAKGKPRAK